MWEDTHWTKRGFLQGAAWKLDCPRKRPRSSLWLNWSGWKHRKECKRHMIDGRRKPRTQIWRGCQSAWPALSCCKCLCVFGSSCLTWSALKFRKSLQMMEYCLMFLVWIQVLLWMLPKISSRLSTSPWWWEEQSQSVNKKLGRRKTVILTPGLKIYSGKAQSNLINWSMCS